MHIGSYICKEKISSAKNLTNCSTIFQVNYLQITINFNNTSVFIRNLQAHQLYHSLCIPIQTHNTYTLKTLNHLLMPPLINIHAFTHFRQQFRQFFNNLRKKPRTKVTAFIALIGNLINNMKNWFFSERKWLTYQMTPIWLTYQMTPIRSKTQQETILQSSKKKRRKFPHLPHNLNYALKKECQKQSWS